LDTPAAALFEPYCSVMSGLSHHLVIGLSALFFAGACSGGGCGGGGPSGAWNAFTASDGTFGQTFGDNSWSVRTVTSGDLYAVSCVTNSSGWVAGANGYVAHTADAGRSFVTETTPFSSALRTLSFADELLGVVAGDEGALAVTQDGGEHWIAAASGTQGSLRGSAMAAGVGLILVVGDGGALVASRDSGNTWQAGSIVGAANLRSVSATPGASEVLAVDDAGAIWSSTDGARSFVVVFEARAGLDSVQMQPTGDAIAVGLGGTAVVRLGGSPWSVLSTGTSVELHAGVIVPEDGSLYVAGENGTLLESDDRGMHFSAVPLMMTAPIFDLQAL
jgi:photosystem II stability/assembly factor-like uncharacterized protein